MGQVRDWALRTQQEAKETLPLFPQSLQFRPGAPWRSFLSISQHKAIGSAGRHMNEMFVELKPLNLNVFFFHFSNNTTELVFSNPPLPMKTGVQGAEATCQHSPSSLVMSPTFKLKSDSFKASVSPWCSTSSTVQTYWIIIITLLLCFLKHFAQHRGRTTFILMTVSSWVCITGRVHSYTVQFKTHGVQDPVCLG